MRTLLLVLVELVDVGDAGWGWDVTENGTRIELEQLLQLAEESIHSRSSGFDCAGSSE